MSIKLYVGNLAFRELQKELFPRETKSKATANNPFRTKPSNRVPAAKTIKPNHTIISLYSREQDVARSSSRKQYRFRAEQGSGWIEILPEERLRSFNPADTRRSAPNEQVARYLSEIVKSRKRARKTMSEISRVKKKTLAILKALG